MAGRLREALNEGRLDLEEYDERVQRAYAARTYGDLDGLLDDLPTVAPVEKSQVVPVGQGYAGVPEPARPRSRFPGWLGAVWGSWFTLAIMMVVIWVATGAGYFWPVWVIGPWGAVLLVRTIGGLASGTDPREAERERHRAERERRRAQREAQRDDPE